jgi:hypothetical protein
MELQEKSRKSIKPFISKIKAAAHDVSIAKAAASFFCVYCLNNSNNFI